MLTFQFTPFPELRTARLLLRPLRHTDAPALLIQRSDPRVMRYIDREPDQTVEESLALIRKVEQAAADNTGITWAMVRPEQEDVLLGTLGFWRLIPEHHRAEIGYGLHPDYWQQGLMHEALEAVLHFGFHQMRLHSVEANVNPHNTASMALLAKHGFVREAYFREDYYFRGQFLDSAIYSLLTPLRPANKTAAQL